MIEDLVLRRSVYRAAGDYAAADSLQSSLASLGVGVNDFKDQPSTWYMLSERSEGSRRLAQEREQEAARRARELAGAFSLKTKHQKKHRQRRLAIKNRGKVFAAWLAGEFAEELFGCERAASDGGDGDGDGSSSDDESSAPPPHSSSAPQVSSSAPQASSRGLFGLGSRKVLDVAGSKGDVAWALALLGMHATVIDSKPIRLSASKCKRLFDWANQDAGGSGVVCRPAEDDGGLPSYQRRPGASPSAEAAARPAPAPPLGSSAWLDAGVSASRSSFDPLAVGRAVGLLSKALEQQQRLFDCAFDLRPYALVSGMHPDQATELIVDSAIQQNKPFAVVPCCTFADDHPNRMHPTTGEHVRSLSQYLDYLQAKAPHLQRATLDSLEGPTNVVIYGHSLNNS